jgi:lipoate-protein ligase A
VEGFPTLDFASGVSGVQNLARDRGFGLSERAMIFLNHTCETLAENLALDEALLISAEEGPGEEVLRFWEWTSPAVVLGISGSVQIDVNIEACRAAGVPLLRRSSGGGTVLLGAGSLMYSLILSYDRSDYLREIQPSYRYILGRISTAFGSISNQIEIAGISDLTIAGKKFSGNAQQRKARYLLHHGTLLYAFDLPLIDQYLRFPERPPDYRGQRNHLDFVMNLATKPTIMTSLLQLEWDASPLEGFGLPTAIIDRLLEEKYLREDWTLRR